jgi:CRP/FNR family cyclic AMP-dependent transcriptional regulator
MVMRSDYETRELRHPEPTFSGTDAASHDWWHLRNIDWLRDLTPGEIHELQRSGAQRRYAGGEMVFAPTPNPQSIYLLERGLVRIYRLSESGAETSFGYVAPGEVFGELPAFGPYARESFAQAVRPSSVWRLAREPFQRILSARPALVMAVTKQVGERLKRIEARIEDLVFRTVRARVARMLVELADGHGRPDGERIVIDIPITQGELATLVGATRQTVNQTLGEFAALGWVGRQRQRIVVLERAKLAAAAAPVAPAAS